MADTTTTNLSLIKPEPGAAEDTWGISLNTDLDTIDAIFSGTGTAVSLNIDGGDIASAVVINKSPVITLGGDLSGNATLTNLASATLTATVGTLNQSTTGNAATSTALATGRNFSLTGNVTASAVSFDGTGNVALATTLADSTVTSAKLSGALTTPSDLTVGGAFTSQGIDDNADATAITIDSSERVGIGTTSPASSLHVSATGEARLILEGDSDNDSGEESALIEFRTDGGAVRHRVEATGTGGNDLKITAGADQTTNTLNSEIIFETKTANASTAERMRIDADGNVGIGVSSIVREPLQVHRASTSDVQIHMTNSATGSTASDGMTIFSNSTTSGFWQRESANMLFATSSSERMRIDSSGNLLVGKSANSFGTAGLEVLSNGRTFITVANDECLNLNRENSDGLVLRFFKDTSLVGSVSTNANSLPSDKNFKRDISDLNLGLNLINKLKPSEYNYIVDDKDSPKMYGLIAQDLEKSLTEVGIEKNSTWLLQHEPNDDEKQSDYSLDYLKLTPVLIKAIQEQQEIIDDLKTRIEELEA